MTDGICEWSEGTVFVVVWDLFFPSPSSALPMAGRPAEFAADQPRCLSVKGSSRETQVSGAGGWVLSSNIKPIPGWFLTWIS